MNRLLKALLLTLFTLPAWAQQEETPEPWYEVEIILFENLDPQAMESETWPLQVDRPDLTGAIHLLTEAPQEETHATDVNLDAEPQPEVPAMAATGTDVEPGKEALPAEENPPAEEEPSADESASAELPTPYLILPPETYQLNDAYAKLADSQNYLPLLHIAWRQIIPPREKADRIYVDDLIYLAEKAPEAAAEELPVTEMPPSDMLLGPEPKPEPTISGIISIGLSRYLHVNADLILHKPGIENEEPLPVEDFPPPPTDEMQLAPMPEESADIMMPKEEQTPEYFLIQGNLRMRSGEVHYLDHPLAGMLILFTPYTIETAEPETDQAGEETPATPIEEESEEAPADENGVDQAN
jgi:hypothetical protein